MPIAVDTRAFKRSLHHSDRYNRRGFGLGDEVAGSLEQAYQSDLVASIRENGHELLGRGAGGGKGLRNPPPLSE